mmetsp:Transcript_24882/g.36493  ORF Transcript_24882/g.36493 Transcript_24882/m.36493 type:complete len:387 (-) Transcript_24882:476-1636(-)
MTIMQEQFLHKPVQRRSTGALILLSLITGATLASFLITNECNNDIAKQFSDADGTIISSTDMEASGHVKSETDMDEIVRTDPDPNAPWPRVAWLMSFPNSGTSYTIQMTQRLSNRTAASNYGEECTLDESKNTIPVHANSPNGPFLLNSPKRKVPDTYILTKTHCIGYGTSQPPEKYIETKRSFLKGCTRSGRITGDKKQEVYYDERIVQRAIHLIRDPFNNIVSRFHLQQHRHTKKNDQDWLKNYPSTVEGLKNWCNFMDERYKKEERDSRFLDKDLLDAFKGVPCHSEFFQYAQWHQHTVAITRDLKIPTLVMHYEEYEKDINATVKKAFDFLELEPEGYLSPFITGKNYDEYFNKNQRAKTMKMIKLAVDPETWELLEEYDTY